MPHTTEPQSDAMATNDAAADAELASLRRQVEMLTQLCNEREDQVRGLTRTIKVMTMQAEIGRLHVDTVRGNMLRALETMSAAINKSASIVSGLSAPAAPDPPVILKRIMPILPFASRTRVLSAANCGPRIEQGPQHGNPYWDTPESNPVTLDPAGRLIAGGVPLRAGDCGFFCIGCQPGSLPEPFIVADVDAGRQKIGLVFPYVFVLRTLDETRAARPQVELAVGADMTTHYDLVERGLSEIHSEPDPAAARTALPPSMTERPAGDSYNVVEYSFQWLTRKETSSWLSMNVGSFGNTGLPQITDPVTYEFLATGTGV